MMNGFYGKLRTESCCTPCRKKSRRSRVCVVWLPPFGFSASSRFPMLGQKAQAICTQGNWAWHKTRRRHTLMLLLLLLVWILLGRYWHKRKRYLFLFWKRYSLTTANNSLLPVPVGCLPIQQNYGVWFLVECCQLHCKPWPASCKTNLCGKWDKDKPLFYRSSQGRWRINSRLVRLLRRRIEGHHLCQYGVHNGTYSVDHGRCAANLWCRSVILFLLSSTALATDAAYLELPIDAISPLSIHLTVNKAANYK